MHPGVLAASTLLPDRHHGIAVRVVNTTPEPHVLRGDTCLGTLSRVDVSAASVQPEPVPVQTQSSSTAITKTEIIDPILELMQTLPEESTESQRQAIRQLFKRYEDVMSKSDLDVGKTHLIEHRVQTGDHPPIRQPLHRHPTAYNDAVDEHIDELLRHGILEPCQCPWASNIVTSSMNRSIIIQRMGRRLVGRFGLSDKLKPLHFHTRRLSVQWKNWPSCRLKTLSWLQLCVCDCSSQTSLRWMWSERRVPRQSSIGRSGQV